MAGRKSKTKKVKKPKREGKGKPAAKAKVPSGKGGKPKKRKHESAAREGLRPALRGVRSTRKVGRGAPSTRRRPPRDPREWLWTTILADRGTELSDLTLLNAPAANGCFLSIEQYQAIWTDVVMKETRAQCISDAQRDGPRCWARCLEPTWALLQGKQLRLRSGQVVQLLSPDDHPLGFGRLWVRNEVAGIIAESLKGMHVQAKVLNVSISSSSREMEAIRRLRHIPPALTHQLLGLGHSHVANGKSTEELSSACVAQLNASQALAVGRAVTCSSGFVSIHGPPGTGKSQTLLCLINQLHLQKIQRYHQRIEEIVLGRFDSVTRSKQWHDAVQRSPRLLVTAHSNAAVQQLLRRAQSAFVDSKGRHYRPSACRVSSELSEKGSEDLDALVQSELGRSPKEALQLSKEISSEIVWIQKEVERLMKEIRMLQDVCPLPLHCQAVLEGGQIQYFDEKAKAFHVEAPPAPQPGEPCVQPLQLAHVTGRMEELISMADRFRACVATRERCELLLRSPGQEKLREAMEAMVLGSAELVFATTNTAARMWPSKDALVLTRRFDCVVVDEAAQATEPAVLVPLTLCAGRSCVLLGDHLQLPPTTFLPRAEELFVSRSLFERLCVLGHTPLLLQEQYRMAPEISAFPSSYFYEGRLLDAAQVLSRERCALLPAFLFLNLKSTALRGPGGSWRNEVEADFCARLVVDLKRHAKALGCSDLAQSVGVITPYRAQKQLLMERLVDVSCNTVDAFQGNEFEAVVLSTVRASGATGLGFLSDDRRLNVALTRARQVLLVVGHEETLCQSKTFKALMEHARSSGSFRDVTATDDVLLTL